MGHIVGEKAAVLNRALRMYGEYIGGLKTAEWNGIEEFIALASKFPQHHPEEGKLLSSYRVEDRRGEPYLVPDKDRGGFLAQSANRMRDGTFGDWLGKMQAASDAQDSRAPQVLTSQQVMSPDELQRFVEKMGREGVDPSTLTSGRLDRMIDELHNEDEDLSNYLFAKLAVLRVLREGVFNEKDLGGDLNECRRLMDQARVIACRGAIQDVVSHTDRFLRRTMGKPVDGKSATPLFEKELSELARATLPYPDKLPFPSIYLSFGRGFTSYDTTQVADVLLGILVGEKAAWQFFTGAKGPVIIPVGVYHLGHWSAYCSKAPWCIVQLIDLINSYRTYVEEVPRTLKRKMDFEKLGKGFGIKKAIPPPFYRVKLHDIHIRERAETLFPTNRVLGHRHDRRGHERCKFRRGKLPLDQKLEAKLIERGYELFKQNPVDVNTFRRLSLRGLPYKAQDEWLAVKTMWVKDTVVGDETLPYVPSIHEVPEVGTSKET